VFLCWCKTSASWHVYCSLNRRENTTLENGGKPIRNPHVILREEFDDWAILFDPDTGHGFGLNPTGVFVWKLLDGKHSMEEMLTVLRRNALDVPQEVGEHLFAFIEELIEHGLAEYGGAPDLAPANKKENLKEQPPLVYAKPCLVLFSNEQRAEGINCTTGANCVNGSGACNYCEPGAYAQTTCSPSGLSATAHTCYSCWSGSTAAGQCISGSSPSPYCCVGFSA
jgi:SynChlorMet cassette protein ScmD